MPLMRPPLRQIAWRVLASRPVQSLLRPRMRNRGVVFMLHRVTDPELGVSGHDPGELRRFLSFLRERRFSVVDAEELLAWTRDPKGEPGPKVAFTMDDGYPDQARAARTVFADYDVRVTIFPIVDFLDGEGWMWWDRLTHLLTHTEKSVIELGSHGVIERRTLDLSTPHATEASLHETVMDFRRLSTGTRGRALAQVEEQCQVDIPDEPPPAFAPMSWDDARQLEAMGHRFGPHSMSHPTLVRESDSDVRTEIEESWRRLQVELTDPAPVFCYPYGAGDDFGEREMRILQGAGIEAAFGSEGGYITTASPSSPPQESPLEAFRLPRFGFPLDMASFVRIISGLDPDGTRTMPARRGEVVRNPLA